MNTGSLFYGFKSTGRVASFGLKMVFLPITNPTTFFWEYARSMTKFEQVPSPSALAEALKLSHHQPVLFFKHSNSCGISQRAFAEFERYLDLPESSAVHHYVIVVQTAREASNELARLLRVQHESPQAILVKDGRAVWHDSHLALKSGALKTAVSHNLTADDFS